MDINQWLQNTYAPEEQSLAARPGIPSFLQRVNPEPDSPRYKRKRQRSFRDSSLLEDAVSQQKETLGAGPEVFQDTLDDQSRGSDRSTTPTASAATSAEPYNRRSRKKPKVDKYHPKSGRSKNQRQDISNGRKQAKAGKKVRRSKEKSGVGFVHTFRAKNVAKNRLTVSCQKNQKKHEK